jgi:copper chaperone
MKTIQFKTNIKCSGCVATVTPHLDQLRDAQWEVDLKSPDRILTVKATDIQVEEVVAQLQKAGYMAEKI